MSVLYTYKVFLRPAADDADACDADAMQQFLVLDWCHVPVTVRDVMINGVHPIVVGHENASVFQAFVSRLNQDSAKFADIDSIGCCKNIAEQYYNYAYSDNRFEKMLETVRSSVRFIPHLSLSQLIHLATSRLKENWNHHEASRFLSRIYSYFGDMRTFLHSKNRDLRLSGYDDLDRYDLSDVISVDDFMQHEYLLLDHGLTVHNFRKASVIEEITDAHGRLRLHDGVDDVTLVQRMQDYSWMYLEWHGVRTGEQIRFRPDIGSCATRLEQARHFPKGVNKKGLSFTVDIDTVQRIVEEGQADVTFPALQYIEPVKRPISKASIHGDSIPLYCVASHPTIDDKGTYLADILRHYKKTIGTTKKEFTSHIASLADELYRTHEATMERYFRVNRMVRASSQYSKSQNIKLLDDVTYMGNLLISMYILQHLRGGAIIDPDHEMKSYSNKELALALLNKKTTLTHRFMRITQNT